MNPNPRRRRVVIGVDPHKHVHVAVAASLAERDQLAIESLRAGALRGARRTSTPPMLALFDVLERVLSGPGARGCAFLNASFELNRDDHPAVRAARAHLRSRHNLVAELLRASGMETGLLVDELVLLVDGTFAVVGSRGDPTVARHARRAAERLLAPIPPAPTNEADPSRGASPSSKFGSNQA
jgi:hypothetical protein